MLAISKESVVYRYRARVEDLDPRTNNGGAHRYATRGWISANRNVSVVPDSERTVDSAILDINGMCHLSD